MRGYRNISSGNERALLQEINQLEEEKIKSKPDPSEPTNIEIRIEKLAKIIKETHDYEHFPEDIIQNLIKTRQTSMI